jgi:hypothetical protein
MASIAVTPAEPVAVVDSCKVRVTEADQNTDTGYDADNYPASPEMLYYLTFELGGDEQGRSYIFGTNDEGTHEFYNYVFPEDGSWTVRLNDASDDSSVATASVTVAAA